MQNKEAFLGLVFSVYVGHSDEDTRRYAQGNVRNAFQAELTRYSGCLARPRICFGPPFDRRFISIQGIMERLGGALSSREKPVIAPEAEAAAKKRAAKRKENSLFERVQHHPVLSGKAEKERKRELRKIDTRPHWRKPKGLVRKVRDFVQHTQNTAQIRSPRVGRAQNRQNQDLSAKADYASFANFGQTPRLCTAANEIF